MTVTIKCKCSSNLTYSGREYLSWSWQKPGQAPTQLIYDGVTRKPGVPAWFSGTGTGTDFTLTVSSIEATDAGDYYCQYYYNFPLTVLQPTVQKLPCSLQTSVAGVSLTVTFTVHLLHRGAHLLP